MKNESRISVRTLTAMALLIAMSIVFSRVLSISTGFVRFNLGSLPVLLAGILSFFVMQYLQGWLEKLLQIGTGVYETAIYSAVGDVGSIETTVSALGYMGSAMVTLGIAAAFGVFWFGLTVWLMRNKLNLE